MKKFNLIIFVTISGYLISLYFNSHSYNTDPTILDHLLSQYPLPVNISPDFKKVLLKTRNEFNFQVSVFDLDKKEISESISSENTQLSLTWSPTSKQVIFQSSTTGDNNYKLFVWNIDSGKPTKIDVPITYTAAPPIRWSPDGQRFAYYCGNGYSGNLNLVYLKVNSVNRWENICSTAPDGDFAWSPKGTDIALVSGKFRGTIELVSVNNNHQKKNKTFCISNQADIRQISWSPDGNYLLVSLREDGEEYNRLDIVNIRSKKVYGSLRLDSCDILNPKWLNDSKRFIFQSNKNGIMQIILSDIITLNLRNLTNIQNINEILGVSSLDEEIFFMQFGLIDLPKIISLSLQKSSDKKLVYPLGYKNPFLGARPEFVNLMANDGVISHGFFWNAAKQFGNKPTAIIFLHGGPHLFESPKWNAGTQLLVEKGINVFILNYRGSTTYGAKYEGMDDVKDQVNDIFAACEYLKKTLNIDDNRIFLMGTSYGTFLAAQAMSVSPKSFGGAFFISSIKMPSLKDHSLSNIKTILAFHGKQDNVSNSESAQNELIRLFGNDCEMKIFENEGHLFHHTISWSTIYNNILQKMK